SQKPESVEAAVPRWSRNVSVSTLCARSVSLRHDGVTHQTSLRSPADHDDACELPPREGGGSPNQCSGHSPARTNANTGTPARTPPLRLPRQTTTAELRAVEPVSRSSIAIDCWLACKSHPINLISASFNPSAASVDAAHFTRIDRGRRRYDITVYAGEVEVRAPRAPTTEADKAALSSAPPRLIRASFFEHRLHVRPIAADDLPTSVEALIDLGRVPPRGCLRAVAHLRSVVDEVEGEHRKIAAALALWVDHLSLLDLDLAVKGREVVLERVLAIDALGCHRIEVGLIRRHDVKEPLRIALPPPIKGTAFERVDGFWLKVVRRAAARDPAHRGNQKNREYSHHSNSSVDLKAIPLMS